MVLEKSRTAIISAVGKKMAKMEELILKTIQTKFF